MRYVYDVDLEEFIVLRDDAIVAFVKTEEEAKRMIESGDILGNMGNTNSSRS